MSILIKGMEMPKCCDECVFMETQDSGFGNDYICSISKEDVDGVCDCPLIEVSPHHGRLIDADELEYHANNVRDPMGRTEKTVMWKKIKAAPTVIPADKDGEDGR